MNFSEIVYPVMAVNLRHGYSTLLRNADELLNFFKTNRGFQKKVPQFYFLRMSVYSPPPYMKAGELADIGYNGWTWRLLDDAGRIVYADVIKQEIEKTWKVKYRKEKGHKFRNGPVPHTGHKSWGGYYRSIHTTAEIRANFTLCDTGFAEDEDDDYIIDSMVAKSGKARHLPTAWDDIVKVNERSWKRHRKTQWKNN